MAAPADLAPSGPQPDWDKLAAYLDTLYDPTQSMLRSAPAAASTGPAPTTPPAPAPLVSADANTARRDAILSVLRSRKICGCDETSEHDATINHHHDPLVTKGAIVPTTPKVSCSRIPRKVVGPASFCDSSGSKCPQRVDQP